MNYKPALLALSALALAACGEQASENESAVSNQLEAADNVMWNDSANTSLDADLSTNAAAPAADAEAEAETPSSPATSTSREPTKAAAPKAKASEPVADSTPEPSSPPAETCAPEHRAAGHC